MKYLSIYFLITVNFSINVSAQPAFQWAKALTSDNMISQFFSGETHLDAAGNVYTSGAFNATVDFDPGSGSYLLTNQSWPHVFVCKLNADGNFILAKCFSGTGYSYCKGMCVDLSGNVYLTGNYTGTVDFDPGPGNFLSTTSGTAFANFDTFVVKLDAQGNFAWAHFIVGGPNSGGSWSSQDIAVDNNGNCYVTGTSRPTQLGIIFTAKYDPQGNLTWMKQMDRGDTTECAYAINIDISNNVLITGVFSSVIDFDPGPGTFTLGTANGSKDVFIQKLDGAGNFIWAKRLGGNCEESCLNIVTDNSGNVYTLGNTIYPSTCTGDFDPGPNTYALQFNLFFSKLDSLGNFVWAKSLMAPLFQTPQGSYGGFSTTSNCLAIDSSANIYSTGFFYGTADLDPGPSIFNLPSTCFYLKLDSEGDFKWALPISFSARSLAVSNDGNDICCSFVGAWSPDLDPGPAIYNINTIGYPSTFVHKLSYAAGTLGFSSLESNHKPITLFPNPNKGRFTLSMDYQEPLTYYLVDATGKILKSASVENAQLLDFTDLNLLEGLYLLRLSSGNIQNQITFVIN